MVTYFQKEMKYQKLLEEEENYLVELRRLEKDLQKVERDLERVGTLEFVEEYAREKLKMIGPHELYFQIYFDDEEE